MKVSNIKKKYLSFYPIIDISFGILVAIGVALFFLYGSELFVISYIVGVSASFALHEIDKVMIFQDVTSNSIEEKVNNTSEND